jgi:hypothetical protein
LDALARRRAKFAWVKLIVAGLFSTLAALAQILKIGTPWSFLLLLLLIASMVWVTSDVWGSRATRVRRAFRRSM